MLNCFKRTAIVCGFVCVVAGSCCGSDVEGIVVDVCENYLDASFEGVAFQELGLKITEQLREILNSPEKYNDENEDENIIDNASKLLFILDNFYRNAAANGDPGPLLKELEQGLNETITESVSRVELANSFVKVASQLHRALPDTHKDVLSTSKLKRGYVFSELGMTCDQIERTKCLDDFYVVSCTMDGDGDGDKKHNEFFQSEHVNGLDRYVKLCFAQAIYGAKDSSDFSIPNYNSKLSGFKRRISMLVDLIGGRKPAIELIGCFLNFKTAKELEFESSCFDSEKEFQESLEDRKKFYLEQAKNIVDLCSGKIIPQVTFKRFKNRSVFSVFRNGLSTENIVGFRLIDAISKFPALDKSLAKRLKLN